MIHAASGAGVRARPVRRLGAASVGGLALPDASPTADHMYAPRGVWTDGTRVVVADSGNHRVLIWHTFPDRDGDTYPYRHSGAYSFHTCLPCWHTYPHCIRNRTGRYAGGYCVSV